jgi:hypothetical protein
LARAWLTAVFGVVLVVIVVLVTLPRERRGASPGSDVQRTAPAAVPAPSPPEVPAEPPAAEGAAPARGGPTPAAPRAGETGGPPITSAVLQVNSDVPGASVFLDRQYVGKTPLTLRGLTPGERRLNVSAEGHDGYASAVTLTSGTNTVSIEFKRVILNASVPVVHKHALGRCEGTLVATPEGLRYETSNRGDAFSLPLDQLEQFDVDYLKKNLRVKRLGGKTWNFTTSGETADPLLLFQRDVQKARDKLAAPK